MAHFNNNSRSSRNDHSSTERYQAVLRALGFLAVMLCALGSGPAQARDCTDYVNGTLGGFAGEGTPTNTPSTRFVNTAKRDVGTYEIATL